MRTIIFRGKSVKTGEWKFGCFYRVKNESATFIFSDEDGICYEVIPESIGQFSGLVDKEGTEIYEGDVLEVAGNLTYSIGFANQDPDDEFIASFTLNRGRDYFAIDHFAVKNGLVVGNIHKP